jgi:hypothetical protein
MYASAKKLLRPAMYPRPGLPPIGSSRRRPHSSVARRQSASARHRARPAYLSTRGHRARGARTSRNSVKRRAVIATDRRDRTSRDGRRSPRARHVGETDECARARRRRARPQGIHGGAARGAEKRCARGRRVFVSRLVSRASSRRLARVGPGRMTLDDGSVDARGVGGISRWGRARWGRGLCVC